MCLDDDPANMYIRDSYIYTYLRRKVLLRKTSSVYRQRDLDSSPVIQGVQCRMALVVIFFVFLKSIFFALLLIYVI